MLSLVAVGSCQDHGVFDSFFRPAVVVEEQESSTTGFTSAHTLDREKSPRIIGGTAAGRNTYPRATVLIADRQEELVCGGTLISPTLVLTAAHCARGILDFVQVGRYNRIHPLEEFDTIAIVSERVHPQFDPVTLDFDMLLLELERPTKLPGFADEEYMKINPLNSMPPVGATLMALGWGETQPNGSDSNGTPVLQKADVTVVGNTECNSKKNSDEDYTGTIMESMLCTFASNADHCYGDSGGPILAVSPSNPLDVMQVAIISWGADKCADGFFPGVNQRTSISFDWVASWICAIDGSKSTVVDERYGCVEGQTFSPAPTPSPVEPGTTTTTPTPLTVTLWIELFMDEWPEDISWFVRDTASSVPMKMSPSYAGNTDDIIVEQVALVPGRRYEFVIEDNFGDGLQDGGFYQLSMGDTAESAQVFQTGNLQARASHQFDAPDKIASPTGAPSASPTAASSTSTAAAPVSSRTCAAVNEACFVASDCCSNKCTLGKCMKTAPFLSNRASVSNKISFGQANRGGHAGTVQNIGGIRRRTRRTSADALLARGQ